MDKYSLYSQVQPISTQSVNNVPVVVYTSASGVGSLVQMAQRMWNDLKASRELAWRLSVRDISAQYRQSLFGIFWAFFTPIAMALVFILLNKHNIVNISGLDVPYPAFVMFGTVLWQLFTESIIAPIKIVASNKSILAKVNFPKEALILASIGKILFNLSIKLFILSVVFVVFRIHLTWGILFAPLAILMLMLLGIALGLLLTPIGTLYLDISTALPTVTRLWFFVTPVAYPLPKEGLISMLNILNPVSPILSGARNLALKGTLVDPVPFIVVSILTLLTLLFSWILFRVSMPMLIERMSA